MWFSKHKIAILTGGFDPVTPGHIKYFKEASELVDDVIVYVNSDAWLTRKKGKPFMPQVDRSEILQGIKFISEVHTFSSLDDIDGTANKAIRQTRCSYPKSVIYFMNGGDRTIHNIPEEKVAKECDVLLRFGIGGTGKSYSSSWYTTNWTNEITHRRWGFYKILHKEEKYLVKEVTIEPKQSISLQYHNQRNELWHILSGTGIVYINNLIYPCKEGSHFMIQSSEIHKITNTGDTDLVFIEIQTGTILSEGDIVRLEPITEYENLRKI